MNFNMLDNRKDLTKNKFLGNKLEIFQFSNGYRGNMDSVLVASVAESGQKVLELGSGNGVALCCLLYRISDLRSSELKLIREQPIFVAKTLFSTSSKLLF